MCLSAYRGRFVEAQHYLDRAHDLFDPVAHKGLANRFGQDLGVAASCYLALNLWLLGKTRQANTHILRAEKDANATGHINTICYMHCHVGFIALLAKDKKNFERHTLVLAKTALEHDLQLWQDYAEMAQALLIADSEDKTSIDQYLAADTHYTISKSQLLQTLLRIEAGFRAIALDLVEKAHILADMARTLIDQSGETFALAELHRLEGALALTMENHDDAEDKLKLAIEVACKQGSKSLELRAAIDLANLWQSLNRIEEACTLLKPMYENIASGDCAEDCARAHAFIADHAT